MEQDSEVLLINSIASQTNLLALNATIEAVRAGNVGGQSLANQTGPATEEIVTQITQIQAATREAVEAIGDIAVAVEEQGAATSDIGRTV